MPDNHLSDADISQPKPRTAAEAGWHVSRYNLSAINPESGKTIIVNLMRGTCFEYSSLEIYLLSELDSLNENHPILKLFENRGIICRFDERAVLDTMGRMATAQPGAAMLVICPTMACNFDCPYCFEDHFAGKMTPEVQDDTVALARRMLEGSHAKRFTVTWFGGEPLLALDVIESLSERLIALAEEFDARYEAGIITNGYLLDHDAAERLARCKIARAQITLDGLGEAHDATRYLAGGGATFERIVSNLRDHALPFPVSVRHNIRADNQGEYEKVEEFVDALAKESGNDLSCFSARVIDSEAAQGRGGQVDLLCGSAETSAAADVDAIRFGHGRGSFCGACELWGVGIDHLGNLYQCWEAVDKPKYSFGTAHDWDPSNPLATAARPDLLTCYLNASGPVDDPECRDCIWLPFCAGGCPHKRLFMSGRPCVPYRDDPEAFVRAVFAGKNGSL